jgi:cobalamin biosynthesis Mg chelatase CobN
MSVIALLALACFPVLAQAEDSSGVQYSDDIPTLPEKKNPQNDKKQPSAKTSANGGAAAPSTKTAPGVERSQEGSEDDGSSEQGGVAGGGNGDDRGQGSPGGSAKGGDGTGLQPGDQAQQTPVSEKSDGGSSPLVPILIAILVLAGISIAVVMARQRRRAGPSAPASEAS